MAPVQMPIVAAQRVASVRRQVPSSLHLSHEILSDECDLFRVRRQGDRGSIRWTAPVGLLLGGWAMLHLDLLLWTVWMSVVCMLLLYVCTRITEERLLSVRGLGLQLTRVNYVGQERSEFVPSAAIHSVYIFETFDGFRTRPLLNIRTHSGENVLAFEMLMPPLEFLQRVYRRVREENNNVKDEQ